MLRKFVLLGLCVSTVSNATFANDRDDDDDDEYKYGLGAFVMAQASIFAGGKDEVEVYPWIHAEWGRFFSMVHHSAFSYKREKIGASQHLSKWISPETPTGETANS